MADSPTSGDMFLARRFNFVGLPSERRGGALSYSALRTELGDDNAAALVTKIGVLVQVHHLDKLGIPMQNAVDRILQSLTPDERRTMAQGGAVPPRVEAILSAEAETAKQQQKQAGANTPGANTPATATGDLFLRNSARMLSRDGDDRQASSNAYARTLNAGAADVAAMRALGLSDATSKALAGMGFKSPEEVKALVRDASALGVDKNRGALALGMIKSDDPGNYEGHRQFFEHTYRPGLESIEGLNDQIAAEKDPARKAELTKKRDEARAALETQRQEQRKKSEGHPKAQQGFDDMSRQMQSNAAIHHRYGKRASSDLSNEGYRATRSSSEQQQIDKIAKDKRAQSEAKTTLARAADVDDAWGDDPKPEAPRNLADRTAPEQKRHEALKSQPEPRAEHAKDKARELDSAKTVDKKAGDNKQVKTASNAPEKPRTAKPLTPT